MIAKKHEKSLIELEPINQRIIKARFESNYCKLTLIQVYAPTNDAEEDAKDSFYEALQSTIDKTPRHDMLLVVLNAKIGKENEEKENIMGKHGCGNINENGDRLVDLCEVNNLIIGGTIFPHKDIHKKTWISPDGVTVNQIDHILINSKWRSSMRDVRTYRGADVASDHHLVATKIKLKLRKAIKKIDGEQGRRFNIIKLKDPQTKKAFVLSLKNRFPILTEFAETEEIDVEETWKDIKSTFCKAAEEVIGYTNKKRKEWISDKTWKTIEERRILKDKVNSAHSERQKER